MLFKQEKVEKILMKLCKERGVNCSQKAASTPLNLKSKAWNQGKKGWVQEHYLVILVKREELKVF